MERTRENGRRRGSVMKEGDKSNEGAGVRAREET